MLPDLTKDPDGDLTLYIQNTSPAPQGSQLVAHTHRRCSRCSSACTGQKKQPSTVNGRHPTPEKPKASFPAVRKVASVDRSSTDSYLEVGTPYHRPERPEGGVQRGGLFIVGGVVVHHQMERHVRTA